MASDETMKIATTVAQHLQVALKQVKLDTQELETARAKIATFETTLAQKESDFQTTLAQKEADLQTVIAANFAMQKKANYYENRAARLRDDLCFWREEVKIIVEKKTTPDVALVMMEKASKRFKAANFAIDDTEINK